MTNPNHLSNLYIYIYIYIYKLYNIKLNYIYIYYINYITIYILYKLFLKKKALMDSCIKHLHKQNTSEIACNTVNFLEFDEFSQTKKHFPKE